MDPSINDPCVILTTANKIWDSIHGTRSKDRGITHVYEIKIKNGTNQEK